MKSKAIVAAAAVLSACGVFASPQATTIEFPVDQRLDARAWLGKNGFVLKNGAEDASKFGFSFSSKGLNIKTLRPALGLLVKEGMRIENFKKLTITWGVETYPSGANWDKKVHNEPIMVYVFFGDKSYPSDSWFIPSSPAFIGFYLGKDDQVGKMRTGRHFTTAGRYVCVANPPAGKAITSEIDLVDAFRKAFGNSIPLPKFVSGISIESDTSDLARGVTSSAFIGSLTISP